jgi:HK97 family phage major capsid protein
MKIKYLSGKKLGTSEDVTDVIGKPLIEQGYAEEIVPENELDLAMKDFKEMITKVVSETATAVAQQAADKAATTAVENINKGLAKIKGTGEIVVGPDRELEDRTGGFKSSSHFYSDVAQANSRNNPFVSKALGKYIELAKKSTVGNAEGTITGPTYSADGIPVPITFATEIFRMYGDVPDFTTMIFQVPMATNFTKIPVLKNYVRQPVAVSAGAFTSNVVVSASIPGESTNIPQSKTVWEQISLTLSKESVVVPVSNELYEDNNVALGSVISEQASYQIKKQINGGIIAGGTVTGASSAYTGIIGHASTLHQNRAVANQVGFGDVMGMYAKFAFDDANFGGSAWFCHPTVLPQLANMTSGNYNIYFPPGGARGLAVDTLLGRPLHVTGWCQALGSPGDLLLVDMKKYVGGYKGGLTSFVSPHVFFLTDEQAFRFTMRVTGKPGLTGPITLEDGSSQVSPFIQLGSVVGGS